MEFAEPNAALTPLTPVVVGASLFRGLSKREYRVKAVSLWKPVISTRNLRQQFFVAAHGRDLAVGHVIERAQ